MCEMFADAIHECNYVPHVRQKMARQHLNNPLHRRWVFVVGNRKGFRYPMGVGGNDEFVLEQVAKFPKMVFFIAEVNDEEDIHWFDGMTGPDWNTDIETMEGVR